MLYDFQKGPIHFLLFMKAIIGLVNFLLTEEQTNDVQTFMKTFMRLSGEGGGGGSQTVGLAKKLLHF